MKPIIHLPLNAGKEPYLTWTELRAEKALRFPEKAGELLNYWDVYGRDDVSPRLRDVLWMDLQRRMFNPLDTRPMWNLTTHVISGRTTD